MSVDFNAWAQRSDTEKVYLVEISVQRLSDGAVLPLYFANQTVILEDRCYVGTNVELPRLTRKTNNTLSPNHIPTWGELELALEMDYLPDAYRSVTWLELLSPAYNFLGRPLRILLGGKDFAYGDFQPVFEGNIGGMTWDDAQVTLTLYDKSDDLKKKAPDYELPESPQVIEENWNQIVPLVLGPVKNYMPPLITASNPGAYPYKYALAPHVIQSVDHLYMNCLSRSFSVYGQFHQRDLSPIRRDAQGNAGLAASGPYIGSLIKADWRLQIDSVTRPNEDEVSGPEVGLATFRWSRNNGLTWEEEGKLTWKLAPGPVTKNPAVGNATMTLSGEYTGEIKRSYQIKVVRGGGIGDIPPPQVAWSDDDGFFWSDPVDILNTAPVPMNRGLSAAFTGPDPGSFVVDDLWAWSFQEIPIPLEDGLAVQFTTQGGQDFYLWDDWSFILMSTMSINGINESTDVTVDVHGLLSPCTGGYTDLVGELIRTLLVLWVGWDGEADFDLEALTAFNAAVPYQMGKLVDSTSELGQVIDELLTGIPALYTITRAGKFFIREIVPPTGPALVEFSDVEAQESPKGNSDSDNICRRVYLRYDRNPSANQKMDGGLTQEEMAWYRNEWRQVSVRDDEVSRTYSYAKDLGPLNTALVQADEARALAQKNLNFYKVRREKVVLLCKNQAFLLNLGDEIGFRRSRFGSLVADLFAILGQEINFNNSEVTLSLWR